MAGAVKRTISLPPELAAEAERLARQRGTTLSGVVQEALRVAAADRRIHELRDIQGYWSRRARALGILTEQDLERYLAS